MCITQCEDFLATLRDKKLAQQTCQHRSSNTRVKLVDEMKHKTKMVLHTLHEIGRLGKYTST